MLGAGFCSSSDDSEQAGGGFILLLVFGMLFIGSLFFAYGEFKYIAWGRTAEAQIYGRQRYKYSDPDNPDGPDIIQWDVYYQWNDADDGLRRDRLSLDPFVLPPEDYKIQIDYIPGEMNSRPTGERGYVAIVFVIVSSGVPVVWFVVQWGRGMRHARRVGKPAMPSDIFKRWRRPTNINYGRGARRYQRPEKKSAKKEDLSGW